MAQLFPKTTLEQWRVLHAIVEHGSYAQAATALFRSQSSISYAVSRLQEQLGVTLLEPDGRRMKLTRVGHALLRDARPLLDATFRLEQRAHSLEQGWETKVRLAVDTLCPQWMLQQALHDFATMCQQTAVQLFETSATEVVDLMAGVQVDMGITSSVPLGQPAEWLLNLDIVAVAASNHPLSGSHRTLGAIDLKQHTQVVIRQTGFSPPNHSASDAVPLWIVGQLHTALDIVRSGIAYAWLPAHLVQGDLDKGSLRPLPLKNGQRRTVALHLLFTEENPGPACHALANCLRHCIAQTHG